LLNYIWCGSFETTTKKIFENAENGGTHGNFSVFSACSVTFSVFRVFQGFLYSSFQRAAAIFITMSGAKITRRTEVG